MNKFSKFILKIATYSFITSLVAFGISCISKEEGTAQGYFSGIDLWKKDNIEVLMVKFGLDNLKPHKEKFEWISN